MKRLLITSCLFLFLLIGNKIIAQDKEKIKDDKTKVKGDDTKEKYKEDKTKIKDGNGKMKMKNDGMNSTMSYPYTAGYSSNFVMGNPAHARMVLDLWKDWDDNAFDRHDYFADTVVMYLPDGSVVKGKAANLEGAKKYRGSMTSAKSTIDAWIPLRSVDKKEDWVALWGTETDTWPDGKTETRNIQEVWRINRDGKVDLMRQFTGVPAKMQ
jgi:hypothetical protein